MSEVAIEWYGHSYVRITTPGGTRIVVDPHDGGSLNLPEYRLVSDITIITHDHYDHNAREMVKSRSVLLSPRGSYGEGDAVIRGLPSYHDKARGELRGPNTILIIEAGGLKVAHLGDIGHMPDGSLLGELSNIDVLMLPVGGVYTIDAYEAWELVKKVKPSLVIPLHFWVMYSTLPLDPLDLFLEVSRARRLRLGEPRLLLDKSSLPEKTTIVVFPEPHTIGGRSEW